MPTCPFCGGQVTRVEITSAGGKRAITACCGAGLDLVDNYDVLAGLPEPLRALAIAQDERNQAEVVARERDNAERFRVSVARFEKFHGDFLKGDERWQSKTVPEGGSLG